MDAPKSRPGPRTLRLARERQSAFGGPGPWWVDALRGLRVAQSALRELRGELFTTETSDGCPLPARVNGAGRGFLCALGVLASLRPGLLAVVFYFNQLKVLTVWK